MTVDLDTEVGAVALPVKLCVGNIEQVTGTDDLLGGNAHDTDLCRVATHLRGPVTEELLVGLDTLTVRSSGAPLEVLDLLDLDGDLVEEVHTGQLVDGDTLVGVHASNVLGVGGPLECGPLQLLLDGVTGLVNVGTSRVEGDERAQRKTSLEIPDDVVLAVLVERENGVAFFDLHGAVGPGGEVSLIGREVDEVDTGVGETLLSAP